MIDRLVGVGDGSVASALKVTTLGNTFSPDLNGVCTGFISEGECSFCQTVLVGYCGCGAQGAAACEDGKSDLHPLQRLVVLLRSRTLTTKGAANGSPISPV